MTIRHVLLALLETQPNTGYGLVRLMRDDFGDRFSPRAQQVYAELNKLQASGLVRAELVPLRNRPAKKIYHPTEQGLAALKEWWDLQPKHADRDELLLRLYFLTPDTKPVLLAQVEARLDKLRAQERYLRERLQALAAKPGTRRGMRLFLEAERASVEAGAAWCRRLLGLLDSLEERATAIR